MIAVDLARLVKPLVWTSIEITKEHEGLSGVWLIAWCEIGKYEVHVFYANPDHVMLNGPDIVPTGNYTSMEAAQAAANADHAARVIAALDADLLAELVGALSGLLAAHSEPDSQICCNGHHCGCMGASVRDLSEHDARAVLAKLEAQP